MGGKLEELTHQQNSNLQGGVQLMCMHPWFFSIGLLHLGQGFELAKILRGGKSQLEKRGRALQSKDFPKYFTHQFIFSDSALFFKIHLATVSQSTGRCPSSRHWLEVDINYWVTLPWKKHHKQGNYYWHWSRRHGHIYREYHKVHFLPHIPLQIHTQGLDTISPGNNRKYMNHHWKKEKKEVRKTHQFVVLHIRPELKPPEFLLQLIRGMF